MSERDAAGMIREYVQAKRASLDPRFWAEKIKETKTMLEDSLEEGDKEVLLRHASALMYVTSVFNMVAAGAEQLGLFSDEEHGELMEMLADSTEVHEKAIDIIGDTLYGDAFTRIHNFYLTGKVPQFKDLV